MGKVRVGQKQEVSMEASTITQARDDGGLV